MRVVTPNMKEKSEDTQIVAIMIKLGFHVNGTHVYISLYKVILYS